MDAALEFAAKEIDGEFALVRDSVRNPIALRFAQRGERGARIAAEEATELAAVLYGTPAADSGLPLYAVSRSGVSPDAQWSPTNGTVPVAAQPITARVLPLPGTDDPMEVLRLVMRKSGWRQRPGIPFTARVGDREIAQTGEVCQPGEFLSTVDAAAARLWSVNTQRGRMVLVAPLLEHLAVNEVARAVPENSVIGGRQAFVAATAAALLAEGYDVDVVLRHEASPLSRIRHHRLNLPPHTDGLVAEIRPLAHQGGDRPRLRIAADTIDPRQDGLIPFARGVVEAMQSGPLRLGATLSFWRRPARAPGEPMGDLSQPAEGSAGLGDVVVVAEVAPGVPLYAPRFAGPPPRPASSRRPSPTDPAGRPPLTLGQATYDGFPGWGRTPWAGSGVASTPSAVGVGVL